MVLGLEGLDAARGKYSPVTLVHPSILFPHADAEFIIPDRLCGFAVRLAVLNENERLGDR
jgi:hypothetical protein